jgi:hypothetical protein
MKVLARVAFVVSAVAALLLSYQAAADLYLTGFPDGHLTDYDNAVDMPKHILMWVELGFVAGFLALGFFRLNARARAIGLLTFR